MTALDCLARQSIKMDKKSPINTVSQQTKIYDAAFFHHKNPKEIIKARTKLLETLKIKNIHESRKFTAMLLAYVGDY